MFPEAEADADAILLDDEEEDFEPVPALASRKMNGTVTGIRGVKVDPVTLARVAIAGFVVS